jgi:hypothetical protein
MGVGWGGEEMKYHEFEVRSLERALESEREQVKRLKAYCSYLGNRMIEHAMVINELIPVVSAAILDDVEDALTVSRIGKP